MMGKKADERVRDCEKQTEGNGHAPSPWVVERIHSAHNNIAEEGEGLLNDVDAAPAEKAAEVNCEAGKEGGGDYNGPAKARILFAGEFVVNLRE